MDRDGTGIGARDTEDDGGQVFDVGLLRGYVGYVVRAVRRHRLLCLGIVVGVVSATFGAVSTLPRTYHIEAKLLAQKDASVGGRSNPFGADPLRGAVDLVMGHDNLVSLVKQLELVHAWKQNRAPAQRAKDWVFSLLGRQLTDEEQARGLVGLLETRLFVAPGDGTIVMGLDWPDPIMGARIVDTAQQNFLEQRHVMEISTIAESVSILEEHAAKLRKEIDELMDQGKASPAAGGPAAQGEAAAPASPRTSGGSSSSGSRSARNPEAEADLARKKVMIEAKQRAINDLEDFRQRRLLDLQTNLAEQRSRYTDAHPMVLGLQQNVASVSKESPQVAALRAEVKTLQEEYGRASREAGTASGGGGGGRAAAPSPASAPLPTMAGLLQEAGRPANPAMEAQLGYAVSKYSEIRAQISTARIELDLAQAAFRYRYTVVVPAEPPTKPSKPKVPLIVGAAAIGALGLALVAAVLAEIRSGRLVNRWQVESLLGVPVLAELRPPPELGPRERG